MSDKRFVCRCEDVTETELEHAIAHGLRTIEEVKRYTGLGTGPCQGKECLSVAARWLCARDAQAKASVSAFTARPPLEPVTFGALASVPTAMLERAAADPENIRASAARWLPSIGHARVESGRAEAVSSDASPRGESTPSALGREVTEDRA